MKKGQVTIFVILGVILVVLIMVFIAYRTNLITRLGEIDIFKGAALPEEIQEVQLFTENCIKEISLEGLNLMGAQAGYILPPENTLPINPLLPISNRVPLGDLEIPYWYYETANGIQKEQVPSKKQMEDQLSSYVDANLDRCLANYREFFEEGILVLKNRRLIGSRISDDEVIVNVDMPLNINLKGENFRLDKFNEKIDVPFGELYEIALDINKEQRENSFLEERTIDMFVVYDELPFSETDFSCSPKIWTKTKVRQDFKDILSKNIPTFKVKQAVHGDVDKYLELDLLDRNVDANINLLFLEQWPVFMEVFPSEGEILVGDPIIGNNEITGVLMSFFCLNNYHFVYDIKYPVLFTISKGNFIFQFPVQVIIDNNQAKENKLGTLDLIDTESRICNEGTTKTTVIANAVNGDGSLTPLNDVQISLKCSTTLCDVGTTKNSKVGPALIEEFPSCLNGAIIGEKEGFHKGKIIASTNKESVISIQLEPFYEKEYEIVLINKLTRVERNPEGEDVFFTLTNEEKDYVVSLTDDNNKVNLIPGIYKVSSYVLDDNKFPIIVKGKTITKCVDVPRHILGLLGFKEEKCFDQEIPDIELDQAVTGGANFEFEITRNDLVNNDKLILYTVVDKSPKTFNELNETYNLLEENHLSSAFKEPRWR